MAACDPIVPKPPRFSTMSAVLMWGVPAALLVAAAVAYTRVWQRRSATVQQGHNGFRHIALALANYSDVYGGIPPPQSGSPGYSWRFAIQPFIEGPGVAGMDPAVSWNDPRYATWAAVRHRCYSFGPDEGRDTNMLAVVGVDAAWNVGSGKETSGTESDALLCIECRETGVHWMKPGDFSVEDGRILTGRTIRDSHGPLRLGNGCGGIHLLFADFTIWYLSDETPIDEIRKFLTLSDARKFDRDAEMKAYRIWESRFPPFLK